MSDDTKETPVQERTHRINGVVFTQKEWDEFDRTSLLPDTKKRSYSQSLLDENKRLLDLLVCPAKIYSFPAYCDACWAESLKKYLEGGEIPEIVEFALGKYGYNVLYRSAPVPGTSREELVKHLSVPQYVPHTERGERRDNPRCCKHASQGLPEWDRPIPFEDGYWDVLKAIEVKDQGRYAVIDMAKLSLTTRGNIDLVRFAYFTSLLSKRDDPALADDLRSVLVNYIDRRMKFCKFACHE